MPPRRNIGPYRIEHVLGRGGMGVVYQGVGPDGAQVAIKLIREPSEEGLLRFEREARIRIDHPHVVKLLDTGRDEDGSPYIVFELLRGESLRMRLKRGRLGPAQAVNLGTQLCRGLAAAHAVGIIHRDLKPANVHCCDDGTYKILDFGLALRSDAETQLVTIDRAGMGTPSYLSPEQARGDRDIDRRTDVWSLGVVLYEALSGHKPFERDAALGTMLAIVLEDAERLSTANPSVPSELGAVVDRCLHKSRERRWSTALEIEEALAAVSLGDAEEPVSGVIHVTMPILGDPEHDNTSVTMPTRTEVVSSPSIPAGEQRVVAIVLADGVLQPDKVAAAVQRRGGSIIPLIGRRAIGLFGAERWEGDEVVRAAAAALEARGACERASIASGRAARSGHGIAGAVVRSAEAGCLAGLAGVAVDMEAARWLEDRFIIREAHEGFAEIVAEADDDTPSRTRAVQKASTLGRDLELARVTRAFESVMDDRRPRAVLLSGPLGIGKSRLLRDAVARLEPSASDCVVLQGRAEPHLRENAHTLVGALLHGRARAGAALRGWPRLDGDVPASDRQQAVLDLASEALDDGVQAIECAELLGEILGVRMPESTALHAARNDVRLMNDRIALALQDYLTGLATKGTLVLVLEDLQWADGASLDAIEELLGSQRDAPILVVATTRPELFDARPNPFSSIEVDRIELRGLGSRDVATIARTVAGHALSDALVRTIVERTGGNPLFVEQIALELRDVASAGTEPSLLPLPLTVEAAVQSRLDHLQPAEKELCKRAAVLGRAFTTEEIAALGVARADELLASLAKRDLVVARPRARGARGREHAFRSTLVQEVAYRMLAEGLREDLHRRAAAYLATVPDSSQEERALHHEQGGEPSPAAECWAAAALDAMRRGDGPAVMRCADRALVLGPPEAARFGLHMARADALRFLGRRAEQATELEAAIIVAKDDASLARALAEKSTWLWRTGKTAESIDEGARSVEAARRCGDREVLALACNRYGAALLYAGRRSEAAKVLQEAAGLAANSGPLARASAADLLAQLAAAEGDLGAAREGFRIALDGFSEAGDVRRAANAEANVADAENRIGSYAQAAEALRAAIDKCRRVGNRLGEGYALVNLGYSLTHLGRLDEALVSLDAGAVVGQAAHDARLLGAVRVYRARVVLARTVTAEAVREAEDAATESEALELGGFAVLALATAARGHLALGDVARALALSTRAIAQRDALGSVEEDEAEVFLAHADALRAAGREDDARATLERGRARLFEIAGRIADPERRKRFVDDVAAHRRLAEEGKPST